MSAHASLDDARTLLRQRHADTSLCAAIETELGERFLPEFRQGPRCVVFRIIASPDNAFTFFLQCAEYMGAAPLFLEFLGDRFSRGNEEKWGFGHLRLKTESGKAVTVNLFSKWRMNLKQIREITLADGASLADFHHGLLRHSGYACEVRDRTDWFHAIGKPPDYYYPLLLHCVAHGVYFENFGASGEHEFFEAAVLPNIEKIHARFGVSPLIVRAYPDPDTQTATEDFYWWSYPPHVNAWLLDYARCNGLVLTPVALP